MGRDRDVNIYVKPLAGNPGHYSFTMDEGKGATDELTFNKNDDGLWRWENYRVTFTLVNEEGANLKFSKDLAKVLWAEPTTLPDPPCPTSQQMDGIFWVKHRNDIEDLTLVVTNKDRTKQRFMFAMNFLPAGENDGPSANYVLYDPIGNNENGGWPRSFTSISAATGSATAAGAALGAVATMLLNPAATTMNYVWGAVIGAIIGYGIGLVLGKPSADAARSAPHT